MDTLSTNNWIVIGVGAAVLIFGAWWFMTNSSATTAGKESTEKDTDSKVSIDLSSVISTTSDTESVSVSDQPAGNIVAVSSVTFTQSGWIAVRDDRGWTLGAGRFEAGTHTNAAVSLLRATIPGERYQVLLYIDDGEEEFDFKKEILVTRSDGSIAGTTFKALVGAVQE